MFGNDKNENNKMPKDKYIRSGIISFVVLTAVVLVFFLLYKIDAVRSAMSGFFEIVQPIVVGFVVAYLLNPLMGFIDKIFNVIFTKWLRFKKRGPQISRFIAVILSIAIFLAAIAALIWLIVPELYTSIVGIADTLPAQIDKTIVNVEKFFNQNDYLAAAMTAFLDWEKEFLEKDLLDLVAPYASQVASGVLKTASFLWDFVIGLIVAAYMLLRKERFAAQAKKITYAFLKKTTADKTLAIVRKSNSIFSGFINGKILDSIIMGFLCFIGVSILKMPYPVLVSVIVGVTNVIPVFGPYIGAIPCIALIALVDPWKGLYFAIFIFLLQQFDGNILGPKILGDSTGLSPFWVIFSIIVCGGLFGVPGMVIGVPLFAVIYYLINEIVRMKLSKKELPVETEEYMAGGSQNAPSKKITEDKKLRKKELIERLNDLIESHNALQHKVALAERENEELKALVKVLNEQLEEKHSGTEAEVALDDLPQVLDTAPAAELDIPKNEGFTVSLNIEEEPQIIETVEETAAVEPILPAEETVVVEEVPTVTEPTVFETPKQEYTPVLDTPMDLDVPSLENEGVEYGSVAIGKIVCETVKYTGIISASQSANSGELVNLIVGKGEVSKNEIYSIANSEVSEEAKRELIDNCIAETIDYFKSVAEQL